MQTAKMTLIAVLGACSLMTAQAQSTSSDGTAAPMAKPKHRVVKKKETGPTVEQQIQDLKQQMQTQIDALKQQLADRDAQVAAAQQAAQAAQQSAQAAASQASAAESANSANTQAVTNLQTSVGDIKTTTAPVQAQQTELKKQVMEPTTLHYKGITLTPGGFLAAETVWRQRGIGGDINTQFTGIPFSGASAGKLSEFNGSGRQSRLSLLAEGKNDDWTYRGYYEADFLSAGVTSNGNESNSYTLRQRQVWAQAQSDGGWAFTGGQMWSMLTENKQGITNRTEATPMTIDPQYNVGFVWARQYGFRVTKDFGDKLWLGLAAEEAQATNVGCHTPSSIPAICTAIAYQIAGNTGGLYDNQSNYSYNLLPDFVGKAVFEPGFGHYELEGVITTFRDRYFPNATATPPSAVGALNQTTAGGGLGASGRWSLAHKTVDVGFKGLLGAGIERYGSSTLPEVTVKPNGALEPLRGGSALATVELHPGPKLDVYANFGVDYVEKAVYQLVIASGPVDYGYGSPNQNTTGCQTEAPPSGGLTTSPANCTADNRAIGEGTLGYWYRFYKGSKGTLQQGLQFSYVQRSTWQGTGGSPKATDAMIFSSFRYYIP